MTSRLMSDQRSLGARAVEAMTGTWRALLPAALLVGRIASPAESGIANVSVSPAFFNPSIGQKATIEFTVDRAGQAVVSILDRDRFSIRRLPVIQAIAGKNVVAWDGKDSKGETLPDEAYTPRIELRVRSGKPIVYDPSDGFVPKQEEPKPTIYSRTTGVLSYTLSRPSRVHVQAGQAVTDAKAGRSVGPVLKNIVDREPRIAGSVVERFNGYDESGTIYVPDLPHFAVGVLATSLPDNALITIGNRAKNFFDYALAHRGPEAVRPRRIEGAGTLHHAGLTVFEDRGPRLEITPSGRYDPGRKSWILTLPATIDLRLEADRAAYFLSQPTDALVFVDEKIVLRVKAPPSPLEITLEADKLPVGEHVLAVNWISVLGPVAIKATKLAVQLTP